MKYVLLFVETEEFEQNFAEMNEAERDHAIQLVGKWLDEHSDKFRGRGKLQPAHTATTVRLLGDGKPPLIKDGPFVEGKEVVSGYLEVEVRDLDEVLRMVQTWPGCPLIEIRPLES
jgi:hypothetical protein